jgi:hypothetical protein
MKGKYKDREVLMNLSEEEDFKLDYSDESALKAPAEPYALRVAVSKQHHFVPSNIMLRLEAALPHLNLKPIHRLQKHEE